MRDKGEGWSKGHGGQPQGPQPRSPLPLPLRDILYSLEIGSATITNR